MLLTVKERILIVSILPKESDFVTQKIVRDLKDLVGLSETDWKNYEIIQTPEGQVRWNPSKDTGAEFTLGDKAQDIIKGALKELDKQKKVTEDFISLFDKLNVI